MALEYGETCGFPVWINRCGVLAGAGQFGTADQGVFSYWIHTWRRRNNLNYIGFGGSWYQVRDCLHPRDLVSLLSKQTVNYNISSPQRVCNVGGGVDNAMSLLELSKWCECRFGGQTVGSEITERRFDVPWLVMDSSHAREAFRWEPEMCLQEILVEIALHAEQNPDWLELSTSKW